ncbi:hypothetical protein HID58_014090 [Brassica napus]|uniref:Uncharacterized protein n=1 Tax=Brassica napus TaxID=3708 RepID=A0ABQ8DG98_BRANA|nr:hypothetical protein HID58_014090 [Brassica napus]
MANILISACQKLPESANKTLARKDLLPFIPSSSYLRMRFEQIVYRFLEQGSVKIPEYTSHRNDETLAGAKLMASLMASEDVILEHISEGLLEARSVLSKAIVRSFSKRT